MGTNISQSITGLADLGTDLGGFMTNVTPGILNFIIPLAIVGGILAIFGAFAFVIIMAVKKFGNVQKVK